MARAARTRGGGRVLLAAALLGGLAWAGCAPPSLHGRPIADPLHGPDAIVAIGVGIGVGSSGDTAYALTHSQKLRAWDLRTLGPRTTLRRAGAVGIARDAAVALDASGGVVEAWEPRSGRVIATHRFAHGIATALGVSAATAYIVAKREPMRLPPYAAMAPLPDTELVSWDLASGKIEVLSARRGCDELWLSVDGARALCDGALRDRPSGVVRYLPPLAPEWAPPARAPEPPCQRCGPDEPETGYSLLSAWLAADGRAVYLSYRRTEGGQEWRLDRWIPDPAGKTDGRLEHLAVSHEPTSDRVLAVSRDGRTVVTNHGVVRPPVIRHAPGYEGFPLLAPPATAAAFSPDERLVVTGHGDGRLRLWEADSGQFAGISPD